MSYTDATLLNIIIHNLSDSQQRKIRGILERERKHFERTSTPGHLVWYDIKKASLDRFDEISQA